MIVWTQVLCCWTGSNADCSTDQSGFAKAHLDVIDGQVSHAAHVGLSGGDAFWEGTIWMREEYTTWSQRCRVRKTGEQQECAPGWPGVPPMNIGFLVYVELGFRGPTTWLTSESTSSWTTLASRITDIKQDRMHQIRKKALQNLQVLKKLRAVK